MNEISHNVSQVASMTQNNVGIVRQTTALIGNLAPMVNRVKEAVEQYRV
jgi:methyl-accepting chemotaxis protein